MLLSHLILLHGNFALLRVDHFKGCRPIARAAELGVDRVLEKPPAEEDIMRFVASCTEIAARPDRRRPADLEPC
jgi:hypothetical protein